MEAKFIEVNGRRVPVTMCPPRAASGVLPFSVDPILTSDGYDRGEPCDDDCEVTTGAILDPIVAEAEYLPNGFGTAEIMGFASQPSRA